MAGTKYLKLFETHSEYQTYINGSDKILPNVSYCEDNNDVHYNPYDFSDRYLTFVALEDGTFSCTGSVSYSLDNGETWIELTPNASTPTITTGSSIIWKNTAPVQYSVGSFNSTAEFDIKGNIMSLLYGDNFKGQTIIQNDSAFQNLFYIGNNNGCKIVNAKDLSLPATTLTTYCYAYMFSDCTSLVSVPKLPATTLASGCYSGMFYGCTSLVTAPELPATTLVSNCYYQMFNGCTSLNYIKAMFTTTPSTSYTNSWVDGVSATGTFVKNSTAQWDVSGVNGIPTGWTVQTASE